MGSAQHAESEGRTIARRVVGLLLGPAADTTLTVRDAQRSVSVRLSALQIAAIDVVFACRDSAEELAERVLRAAVAAQPALSNPAVTQNRAWKDLAGLGRAIASVIANASALDAGSFDAPSILPAAPSEATVDLSARVAAAAASLAEVRDALLARTDPRAAALQATAFGIRVPGVLSGATPTSEQLDALLATVESRLLAPPTASPRDYLRALFGGDLPGVVTFSPRDPSALASATEPPPQSLLGSDRLAPMQWLDASARTRPDTARLAEILARLDLVGRPAAAPLIAQTPWTNGDRWIAASFAGAGGKLPTGRLSVWIHAPAGLSGTQPLGGLLIDAWTETVPAKQQDTAIALRFNNPGTRAPQVILLAVSPDPSKVWTADTLTEILSQTLFLSRLRMQRSTTLSESGHMPLVYLGQRPGNTGISFSV